MKLSNKLTIVDTPGFIDSSAIYNYVDYNKIRKYYPKKEIKVKTFQMWNDSSIVINDILRIENTSGKLNSFSFYMNDKLRYEKIKTKNNKLRDLPSVTYDIEEPSDIVINGLGFIRITKASKVTINIIDTKIVSIRKSMI